LSHNGASDAQASVYLWVGVAIGIYVRAQVCKPGYCLYCFSVRSDKSVAYVTNNKRLCLTFCTIEANY